MAHRGGDDSLNEFEYFREYDEWEQEQRFQESLIQPEEERDDALPSDIDWGNDDLDSDGDEWLDEDPTDEYYENDYPESD